MSTEDHLAQLRRLAEVAGPQMFAPGEVEALIAQAERDPSVWPNLRSMLREILESLREVGIEMPASYWRLCDAPRAPGATIVGRAAVNRAKPPVEWPPKEDDGPKTVH